VSIAADRLSPAQQLERVAAEVAVLAATHVRRVHGSATEAGTKSTPTDVVTQTDVDSEQLIRSELMQRAPGSSIVGEELADRTGSNRIGWIVDPIDGTVNFLYGLPVVSVSIAATVDGQVIAGAVVDVVRGDVFSAAHGCGAQRTSDGTAARISVADQHAMELSLIGTGFAYEASIRQEQAAAIGRLLPACRDIRCMGSAALNLCWVGAGLLDGYFERDIKVYDYAAGALIAAEAGASVEHPSENALDLMLASTPAIAEPLRALVT